MRDFRSQTASANMPFAALRAASMPHREIAVKSLPEKPYPTLAGIKTILDETALRNPKAKGMRAEDFIDSSFVKRLDDEGLYEKLYKK